MMRYFLCVVSALVLTLSVQSNESLADVKKDAEILFKRILAGTHYLGGKKPGIERIDVRGKPVYDASTDKYFYRVKAFVRRSGGDKDGFMVLYSAPTWGAAAKRIFGFRPNLRMEWALRLGLFGYAKRFPPLKAEYTYLIGAKDPSGKHLGFNVLNRVRRKRGPKMFVEDLPWKLNPGAYEIMLASEVTLMEHPITSLMEIWDWYDFADKVKNPSLPSILDIAKDAVKWVIKNKLTRTDSLYRLDVRAHVPKVIGMYDHQVKWALNKWNLRASYKSSEKCQVEQYGKIIKQWPNPNKLLDTRTPMSLVLCSRRPPAPTPTATPKVQPGIYYLFHLTNAGNSLYIGTEESLRGRTPASFQGGGMNNSIPVTYRKLSGPFSNRTLAEEALCRGMASRWWNQVVPWGPFVNFLGSVYGAFDSSVESVVLACQIRIIK